MFPLVSCFHDIWSLIYLLYLFTNARNALEAGFVAGSSISETGGITDVTGILFPCRRFSRRENDPDKIGRIHGEVEEIIPFKHSFDILTFSTAISKENNSETTSKQGKTKRKD